MRRSALGCQKPVAIRRHKRMKDGLKRRAARRCGKHKSAKALAVDTPISRSNLFAEHRQNLCNRGAARCHHGMHRGVSVMKRNAPIADHRRGC